MGFIIRVLINAVAVWLTTLVITGIQVIPDGDSTFDSIIAFVVIGLIFGLVNAIVKPIVKLFTGCIYVLTLGLFTLVVNAGLLSLTQWISHFFPIKLTIDSFWSAVWGALFISVISWILSLIIPDSKKHRRNGY